MQFNGPIDAIPLWGLFAITVAAVLGAVEVGFRLGISRHRRSKAEHVAPVGAMVGATLALLAFMLAFTFNLASSRYDARRTLSVEMTGAIKEVYLRAEMLPEPHRAEVRALLREYVDSRLHAFNRKTLDAGLQRQAELEKRIWEHASAVGAGSPNSIVAGLFVASVNRMIEMSEKRLFQARELRIPWTIWTALYLLAILGMGATGYHAGVSGGRSPFATVALVLAFSSIMLLIADLDRPGEGFIRFVPQSLHDVRDLMQAPDR
jgi:hypothetical protein